MDIWEWLLEPRFKPIKQKKQQKEQRDKESRAFVSSLRNIEKITAGLSRYEGFKKLIEQFSLSNGIELGVREAYFSTWLLENATLKSLCGIDIAECPDAKILRNKYPFRYKFYQKDAILAAKCFPDEYFDFVHIDDCHKYYHLKKELEMIILSIFVTKKEHLE